MGMAVLSPCPLLVNETSGAVLMVSIYFFSRPYCFFMLSLINKTIVCVLQVLAWFFFIFILSFVKVIIAVILRDEGHSALVWCGAVVQIGSMLGAVTIFPLVNVYDLFTSGDPCNKHCI